MILVADIGGTNMRVALGDADGTIQAMQKLDTPASFEEGIETLIRVMQELKGESAVERVVVGVPGTISEDKQTLISAAHLPAWNGQNMGVRLTDTFQAPAVLENDAALGALGEALKGAGAGFPIVAYIAIGTGIGGARVVDGHLDRAAFGSEMGHQYLSYEGKDVELEDLVSGSAIEEAHGIPAKDFDNAEAWQEYSKRFAHGLYNTLLHWSPDCVVLGGSLMRPDGMQIADIVQELEAINQAIPEIPPIKLAELEYPGLVGALVLPV